MSLVGGIFYSSNGGISWFKSNAPDRNWRCISASVDGQYLSAGSEGKIQQRSYVNFNYHLLLALIIKIVIIIIIIITINIAICYYL